MQNHACFVTLHLLENIFSHITPRGFFEIVFFHFLEHFEGKDAIGKSSKLC